MNSTAVISRFKGAHRLTGVFSRVAERLSLTPNHVREVALGNRTSERVMKALHAEIVKLDRAAERERAA